MDKKFISKTEITINAPAAKIWEALTNSEMIKQYLFGTEAISDWKEGSPIIYKGVWDGKAYEDKGIILKVIPEKLLESTYWNSMSGQTDIPANYKKVTYGLISKDNDTKLTITQDNNATEEEKNHSEKNLNMVLEGLKKLLEK